MKKTALRFDLTVPLARVMAGYSNEISKPFKRYQVGNVWRGERAQAGRFREFLQFDADIVGAPAIAADAEFISLIYEAFSALGFKKFVIRVNNRKVLNALPEYANFPKVKMEEVLRIMDKLDKIGWKKVEAELISDPKLKKESLSRIKEFLNIKGTNGEILGSLIEIFGEAGASRDGVDELARLRANIEALGVPDENWKIDLSVARGLGYYTGMVFETVVNEYPELGSVASGGRYDDLVSRFGTVSIPATGGSIGVDRLFMALEKLKLFPDFSANASVLMLNFDDESEMICESLATELRQGVFQPSSISVRKRLCGASWPMPRKGIIPLCSSWVPMSVKRDGAGEKYERENAERSGEGRGFKLSQKFSKCLKKNQKNFRS